MDALGMANKSFKDATSPLKLILDTFMESTIVSSANLMALLSVPFITASPI